MLQTHLSRFVVVASIAALFAGCGNSKAVEERLTQENVELRKNVLKLKTDLDELRNGADRLAAQAEKAYLAKDYATAKQAIHALAERHPESVKNAQFAAYLQTIEQTELEEQARKKEADAKRIAAEKAADAKRVAEEAERKRLANLNNTGKWRIGQYVDEFGNYTANRYIANDDQVLGTFSNSATQNSPLRVDILIDSKAKVAIQLYEYARANPVKERDQDYKIAVQDSQGEKYYFNGRNTSDRVRLDLEDSADALHKVLLKGGLVKFRITETDGGSSYSFEIDSEGYENAIRLLATKSK